MPASAAYWANWVRLLSWRPAGSVWWPVMVSSGWVWRMTLLMVVVLTWNKVASTGPGRVNRCASRVMVIRSSRVRTALRPVPAAACRAAPRRWCGAASRWAWRATVSWAVRAARCGTVSAVRGGERGVVGVALGGAGREVGAGGPLRGRGGGRGEFGLPGPGAVAVRAARIRGDQKPPGTRVGGLAPGLPPAADRLHRERGGVMVGAHIHPAGIRRQVVDPVRDRLAQLRVDIVVGADLRGIALRAPFPAAVLVRPDQ